MPTHGATGWQSAFGFAHDGQIDASLGELVAAHLLALTAYARLRILHGDEPHARKKLTSRERGVLAWEAAGNSAWETSALLGVSEATVITHLDHIRRKLNAANTTHAVVVALQIGELQPC
ncbi:helix-turn-helix domain-containing protein [Microvirga sp. 0TCS3.31]